MKIGIFVLSVMAAIWAAWALHSGHLPRWTYVGAVMIASVPPLLMTTRQFPVQTGEERRRIGRLVGLATFVEGAVIFGGIQVLVHANEADLIACLIAAVVGLHFIPLARWMPMPPYYLTAFALLAAACAGFLIPIQYRDVLVAGAASLTLCATALGVVLGVPRSAARASLPA